MSSSVSSAPAASARTLHLVPSLRQTRSPAQPRHLKPSSLVLSPVTQQSASNSTPSKMQAFQQETIPSLHNFLRDDQDMPDEPPTVVQSLMQQMPLAQATDTSLECNAKGAIPPNVIGPACIKNANATNTARIATDATTAARDHNCGRRWRQHKPACQHVVTTRWSPVFDFHTAHSRCSKGCTRLCKPF